MPSLKLTNIDDDKPVRITVDLPAALHRDLVAYGQAMATASGIGSVEPARLVVPMLQRFTASDRSFATSRRGTR